MSKRYLVPFAETARHLVIFLIAWVPLHAQAWAQRGHAMIANAAAYVLADQHKIFKDKSFDLEYYSNVPDKVWKADSAVEAGERPEHYINLEIYQRETKLVTPPFEPGRIEFFKKWPSLKDSGGRAYWRIDELSHELAQVAGRLKSSTVTEVKAHHELQARWLLLAGILSHYVGDLAMPLHMSENKDGEMTNQKGIHAYFEGDVVDHIYPEIAEDVLDRAKSRWAEYHKKNQKLSVFELVMAHGAASFAKKNELLRLDRIKGRELKNASSQYRSLVLERLTSASLCLAEIWSRHLGWKYNSARFFNFDPKPAYIFPPHAL